MELIRNQERIDAINDFMNELEDKNSDLSKPEIYRKYESYIRDVTAIDIFFLPWYQNDTELTVDEIKETAGKFVNVFYHGLSDSQPSNYDSDLFRYLLMENNLIEEHLNRIKPFFQKSVIMEKKKEIYDTLKRCYELEKKFIKKELIIFPLLEKKLPTTKPLEVLWSLHDDARSTLKQLLSELEKANPDLKELLFLIGDYYNLVYGINNKEELILLPVANMLFTNEEKEELFEETKEYGYVFIDDLPSIKKETINSSISEGFVKTKTGNLSIEQFEGVMKYIPIDITYVDKDDKVTFFNDRKERHFPRNPSIIGRLVKHCHPPKSVHVVEEIVDAFKDGSRDMAEFWIQFKEAFLYITYYAVRSKKGEYLGTLEVSQDVTRIRQLEGQQRLLDWK